MSLYRINRAFLLASSVFLSVTFSAHAQSTDVQSRLNEWLILTSPEGTNLPAERYADFLTKGPIWPQNARILWRYQNALSQISDPDTLKALCRVQPLTIMAAFLVCHGQLLEESKKAKLIWQSGAGSASDESLFLNQYSSDLSSDDYWKRYETLEKSGNIASARRQISFLTPAQQALAQARLAQKTNSADADYLFSSLPSELRQDPTLIRYRLKMLRHSERFNEALDLWHSAGIAIQENSPSHEWSAERLSFAHALLLNNDIENAANIADDTSLPLSTSDRLEAQFFSGFIQLRFFKKPDQAEHFFSPLTDAVSLATQSQGWYWIGRSRQELGDVKEAQKAFINAAKNPTTFYGQLALAALNNEIGLLNANPNVSSRFLSDLQHRLDIVPNIKGTAPENLQRSDLVQAAILLSQSGNSEKAKVFLLFLLSTTHEPADQKSIADLSERLNIPAGEVFAAHTLAHSRIALYPQGYPSPWQEPTTTSLPSDFLLSVIRQESGFDTQAISSAHAIGLLQLLPTAAYDVARKAHLRVNTSSAALLDPSTNILIGSAYLEQLLEHFDNVVPYALAAYNAGPHRVDTWLQSEQSNNTNLTDEYLIDWIEKIPYQETRTYIKNIEGNMWVYRASKNYVR
ncbi:lytic transglycosylase domain-containing protein [Swingsia samuiensis]|uniref:Lytic transglycosylase domain-containing protein n=1 Tax=Swingsia samuiensis TaxID=1293412 RepID=A0A4Y6UNA0_9PROT|nr:lytic transglycosylase domain-containing protein [Swingsia samuiensis]QDH17837.1 lytic transglycosylase domain-containing protein [Swingsia samuiensis]